MRTELNYSDVLAVLGGLVIIGVWVRLYFSTRKPLFLGMAVLSAASEYYSLTSFGITWEGLVRYFQSLLSSI